MEFIGAGAFGLIVIGIVFLILVPITAKFRTSGKSKEVQRLEYYKNYDKRMDEFRTNTKSKKHR